MRKKLAVGVGLVAMVLIVTVLVCDRIPQAELPLRVGMTEKEVQSVLGEATGGWFLNENMGVVSYEVTDRMGNRQRVRVRFERRWEFEKTARSWETEPLPRTRPPWLDRALKAVGW
jgi:hypothetical protein